MLGLVNYIDLQTGKLVVGVYSMETKLECLFDSGNTLSTFEIQKN